MRLLENNKQWNGNSKTVCIRLHHTTHSFKNIHGKIIDKEYTYIKHKQCITLYFEAGNRAHFKVP